MHPNIRLNALMVYILVVKVKKQENGVNSALYETPSDLIVILFGFKICNFIFETHLLLFV